MRDLFLIKSPPNDTSSNCDVSTGVYLISTDRYSLRSCSNLFCFGGPVTTSFFAFLAYCLVCPRVLL